MLCRAINAAHGLRPMRALIYLATPTAAAAWTWINGHHSVSAPTARATATHRRRPICCSATSSHPDAQVTSGLHHAGGGSNAEDQLLALGRRHAQAGDLDSAVLQFESAASQAPRSAACKVELGRALVRVGRPAEGFNCLVDAFGIDSLCPGVKEGFREYYRVEIEASVGFSFSYYRSFPGFSEREKSHRTHVPIFL